MIISRMQTLETIFEMAKPFLEEAGRLTDKAEN